MERESTVIFFRSQPLHKLVDGGSMNHIEVIYVVHNGTGVLWLIPYVYTCCPRFYVFL